MGSCFLFINTVGQLRLKKRTLFGITVVPLYFCSINREMSRCLVVATNDIRVKGVRLAGISFFSSVSHIIDGFICWTKRCFLL